MGFVVAKTNHSRLISCSNTLAWVKECFELGSLTIAVIRIFRDFDT